MADDKPLVARPSAWPVVQKAGALQRRIRGRIAGVDQVQWDGVAYGPRNDQALHVWEPNDLAPRDGWPAVLLLHGGGWVEGGWEQFQALAPRLCRRGMVVAAAQYRLGATWPAQLEDAEQALDRVFDMQVDPARVALWGRSAGGHLALLAALRRPELLCGVVAVGAPTDLLALHEAGDPTVDLVFPAGTRRAASPRHATGSLPPTLLLHGEHDRVVPVEHSAWLEQRFPARVHRVIVKGGDHGLRLPVRACLRARRFAVDQGVAWQDPQPRGSKWKRKNREKR